MFIYSYEEIHVRNVDAKYLDADPVLLNLNTDHAVVRGNRFPIP